MNDNVTELRVFKPTTTDIVEGLRAVATAIESGVLEGPITTCAVVIGHSAPPTGNGQPATSRHSTWGFGPRNDPFTLMGLLAAAMR